MKKFSLKNFDIKTAGFWDQKAQLVFCSGVALVVFVLGWFLLISPQLSQLHELDDKEKTLREEFQRVQNQANNLPFLKNQLKDINLLISNLINQLPNQNEIPQLVVDVSQAALANGLQIDLFEPQDEIKHDFYAEKQINVKFTGSYHQLGQFFSAVSQQPRLVTVVADNMKVESVSPKSLKQISSSQSDSQNIQPLLLSFTGTVKTYRYLSLEEEKEQLEKEIEKEKDKNKKKK